MISDALTMQELCLNIATLHTYSESIASGWLPVQHAAYEGGSLRQWWGLGVLCGGENKMYLFILPLNSKLKRKNYQAVHYRVHKSTTRLSILGRLIQPIPIPFLENPF
jgi:hypothetical protein